MNLYQKFSTNKDAETAGVWVDYGDGVELKLRRAGGRNLKYRDAHEARTTRNKRRIDMGSMSEDEARDLMANVYADAIVVDWRTRTGKDEDGNPIYAQAVTGSDGSEVPFSRDNVFKVLSDLPEFFKAVRVDAESVDLFRDDPREADAKN
jgi:hypothetical protein